LTIFIVGVAMFVAGSVVNALGWSVHRRTVAEAPAGYFEWLLEVIRTWFAKLTGAESTTGERLAAFGAIVAALGLVVAVVGLVAWAA
jgi:hypothetical protein